MRTREQSITRVGEAIGAGELSTEQLDQIATLLDGLADARTRPYAQAWLGMTTRNIRESLDRTAKP